MIGRSQWTVHRYINCKNEKAGVRRNFLPKNDPNSSGAGCVCDILLFIIHIDVNSFKNMQSASWRTGRERTIELCCLMQKGRKLYPTFNLRSSRFWILEKTKTHILHTDHALQFYRVTFQKVCIQKKKLRKRAKQKCIDVFFLCWKFWGFKVHGTMCLYYQRGYRKEQFVSLGTRKRGFLTLQNTAVCQCIGHHYQTTNIEIQRNYSYFLYLFFLQKILLLYIVI